MTPERAPGSTFELNGRTYKVVATKDRSCKGCAFTEWMCTKLPTGPCWPGRSDGTAVIFEQIYPPVEPKAEKPIKRRRR